MLSLVVPQQLQRKPGCSHLFDLSGTFSCLCSSNYSTRVRKAVKKCGEYRVSLDNSLVAETREKKCRKWWCTRLSDELSRWAEEKAMEKSAVCKWLRASKRPTQENRGQQKSKTAETICGRKSKRKKLQAVERQRPEGVILRVVLCKRGMINRNILAAITTFIRLLHFVFLHPSTAFWLPSAWCSMAFFEFFCHCSLTQFSANLPRTWTVSCFLVF